METDALKYQEIYEKVVAFVQLETCTRKKLSVSTELLRDLGIDGDDAREFMVRFENEFNVDMSSFNGSDYFGAEGFDFFKSLKALVARGGKSPITLGRLVEAAETRSWTG